MLVNFFLYAWHFAFVIVLFVKWTDSYLSYGWSFTKMRTMCFLFHQVQLLGHLLSIFAVEEFLSNKKNMAILVATLQEMMMLLPTLQIWGYVFFFMLRLLGLFLLISCEVLILKPTLDQRTSWFLYNIDLGEAFSSFTDSLTYKLI